MNYSVVIIDFKYISKNNIFVLYVLESFFYKTSKYRNLLSLCTAMNPVNKKHH